MNNIIKYIPLSNEEEIINAFNKTYYDDNNYYLDFDTILMHLNKLTNEVKNEPKDDDDIEPVVENMKRNGLLKTNKENHYKLTNEGLRIKKAIYHDSEIYIYKIIDNISDEQNIVVYILRNQYTNDLYVYEEKEVTKSMYGKRCGCCERVNGIEDKIYRKINEDNFSCCEHCLHMIHGTRCVTYYKL
jgi:hypothetical protein